MLILRITDEVYGRGRNRILFRRRGDKGEFCDFKRSSVKVNGKNAVVLEITERSIDCDEFRTLLKIYQGRVLLCDGDKRVGIPESVLFNPKKYFMRALLSTLANRINTVNKEWKRIIIKTDDFEPYKEFYPVVKISKSLCLQTKNTPLTKKFAHTCYNEYGAVVQISEDADKNLYDVFLDFEEIDKDGKLIIAVKGKPTLLYPDVTYFENNSEYEKIANLGIDYNTVCAAFSDK